VHPRQPRHVARDGRQEKTRRQAHVHRPAARHRRRRDADARKRPAVRTEGPQQTRTQSPRTPHSRTRSPHGPVRRLRRRQGHRRRHQLRRPQAQGPRPDPNDMLRLQGRRAVLDQAAGRDHLDPDSGRRRRTRRVTRAHPRPVPTRPQFPDALPRRRRLIRHGRRPHRMAGPPLRRRRRIPDAQRLRQEASLQRDARRPEMQTRLARPSRRTQRVGAGAPAARRPRPRRQGARSARPPMEMQSRTVLRRDPRHLLQRRLATVLPGAARRRQPRRSTTRRHIPLSEHHRVDVLLHASTAASARAGPHAYESAATKPPAGSCR